METTPQTRLGAGGLAAWLLIIAAPVLGAGDPAEIPGGSFRSVLPVVPGSSTLTVSPFGLERQPVSNGEFAAFVRAHPEWRRDRIPRLLADEGYLVQWATADRPAPGAERQPVTYVSWFAARAFCAARGMRLPTWAEWELAAAADEDQPDARADPAWRQRILDWYARPGTAPLPEVGGTAANVYGVRDLHGVVWEWVEDFGSLMVSADNREQGDPDRAKYCGAGALSISDKENFAVLMRIALLSSLRAAYTTGTLGFRCARSTAGGVP